MENAKQLIECPETKVMGGIDTMLKVFHRMGGEYAEAAASASEVMHGWAEERLRFRSKSGIATVGVDSGRAA